MKSLLLPLIAALALPTAINAGVDSKVHNLCKDVKDYKGCVESNKSSDKSESIIYKNSTKKRPAWMEEKIKGCKKYKTKKQRDYCINIYSPFKNQPPSFKKESSFKKEKDNKLIYDNNREIEVKAPPENSFVQDSVRQLRIRGKYGRYLTFKGRTKVSYKGTSPYTIGGGVANTNCYGTTCTSYYTPPTIIPGTSGGTQHKIFVYELDCIDLTFNRIGDKHTAGGGSYGWMSVDRDPVANEVSKRYCPKINSLPKKY